MGDIRLGPVESRFADLIWANEPLASSQLVQLCLLYTSGPQRAASFGEQRERRTDHSGEPHPGRPASAYGGDHPGGRGDAALRGAV